MYEKIVNSSIGFIGGLMSYMYGGESSLLEFLALLALMDYISGYAASVMEAARGMPQAGLSSKKGFAGLAKKGLMFVVVLLAHRADVALESDFLMYGAIWFYISNEVISIAENYGRIGLPLPPQIKQIIAILKTKEQQQRQQEQNIEHKNRIMSNMSGILRQYEWDNEQLEQDNGKNEQDQSRHDQDNDQRQHAQDNDQKGRMSK
ncbi:phage holin family protein [Paenibacillus thiaminolyticus]|uniref:phage holin family protein n=1 Tax=Paenibacillus thiaminolyticus TaxID=49283 RepID=UPI002543F484|nr:phage holin family protein [Paenibacillus thiaminolyticus]WII36254.1 phage holin family protein [Paenibacillus thiaminolyticus]